MPYTERSQCCSILCQNPGKLRCTGCRDATPQTVYCSAKCQKDDWRFHKAYCGKYVYTFDITLVGSSNPIIKRTVDVPSWFTFRQLHYTLQYAIGPWQCRHLHEFSFNKHLRPGPRKLDQLAARDERLKIGPKDLYEDDELDYPTPGMPWLDMNRVPKEMEEGLKLNDVFDPAGRLYSIVAPEGEVYPLIYTYDFGDCWEHELIFRGQKLAGEARPQFGSAQGCGPVEDCGGPSGWNEVKAAFSIPVPVRTAAHKQSLDWAKRASGLGSEFNPFREPNVTQMNYEARWENHVEEYIRISGESPPNPPAWARQIQYEL